MNEEDKLCPVCGAKMKQYPHSLTRVQAGGLIKLADYGIGAASISYDLDLNLGEYTNFAKLAYWGLVEKANPNGGERGGIWKLTEKGIAFMRGLTAVPLRVWVYRGEVVKTSDNFVSISSLAPGGWRYRPQHARDGRPFPPPTPQGDMFT